MDVMNLRTLAVRLSLGNWRYLTVHRKGGYTGKYCVRGWTDMPLFADGEWQKDDSCPELKKTFETNIPLNILDLSDYMGKGRHISYGRCIVGLSDILKSSLDLGWLHNRRAWAADYFISGMRYSFLLKKLVNPGKMTRYQAIFTGYDTYGDVDFMKSEYYSTREEAYEDLDEKYREYVMGLPADRKEVGQAHEGHRA